MSSTATTPTPDNGLNLSAHSPVEYNDLAAKTPQHRIRINRYGQHNFTFAVRSGDQDSATSYHRNVNAGKVYALIRMHADPQALQERVQELDAYMERARESFARLDAGRSETDKKEMPVIREVQLYDSGVPGRPVSVPPREKDELVASTPLSPVVTLDEQLVDRERLVRLVAIGKQRLRLTIDRGYGGAMNGQIEVWSARHLEWHALYKLEGDTSVSGFKNPEHLMNACCDRLIGIARAILDL